MNRQTFAKKPERMCNSGLRQQTNILRTCSNNVEFNNHKNQIDVVTPNLNTPQKPENIIKNHILGPSQHFQHSNFSQFDKEIFESLCQNNSNKCKSRIEFTENISNFIDSQSSEKSDLSFRSDIVEIQRKDSSQGAQKITKTTFRYQSNLTTHEIKVFEKENQFKPIFEKAVLEWIDELFANRSTTLIDKQKQSQKFQKFFLTLKNLNINHPFREIENTDLKGFQTLESIMDKWLLEYSKYQKIILSFDFMFSHVVYVVLMIFYWLQLEHNTDNPLISDQEKKVINRNKNYCHENILNNLRSYISQRSRQMIYNPIIQKLLLQFEHYLSTTYLVKNTRYQTINSLCNAYIEQLCIKCYKQSVLKETLNLGKNFNDAHLDQIYQKYENKDKFIEQNLQEQVILFCEIDKRNFVSTPLNRYYQTGSEQDTNKILAQNHTYLSCWLLNLVLKRCKTNLPIGVKYCFRFYELAKQLYRYKNLQRTVFFINILYNIKAHIKNLWDKFVQDTEYKLRNEKINDQLFKIRKQIEKTLFSNLTKTQNKEIIIFEQSWVYKIINDIKLRYREKNLVNLNFHQDIQDFAKKILVYRKALEGQLLKKEQIEETQQNKTIKLNLNFRFLNYYIFEILKKKFQVTEIQLFEKWKNQANAYVNSTNHHFLSKFF